MLISTAYLEKEKRDVIKEMLNEHVQTYLKFNDHCEDDPCQAIKSITDYLISVYRLRLFIVGKGMFYSLYLILRRSYRSMFGVVCQQHRMRAKSNNRKIVTTVQMFILKCEVLSAVAVVAA